MTDDPVARAIAQKKSEQEARDRAASEAQARATADAAAARKSLRQRWQAYLEAQKLTNYPTGRLIQVCMQPKAKTSGFRKHPHVHVWEDRIALRVAYVPPLDKEGDTSFELVLPEARVVSWSTGYGRTGDQFCLNGNKGMSSPDDTWSSWGVSWDRYEAPLSEPPSGG